MQKYCLNFPNSVRGLVTTLFVKRHTYANSIISQWKCAANETKRNFASLFFLVRCVYAIFQLRFFRQKCHHDRHKPKKNNKHSTMLRLRQVFFCCFFFRCAQLKQTKAKAAERAWHIGQSEEQMMSVRTHKSYGNHWIGNSFSLNCNRQPTFAFCRAPQVNMCWQNMQMDRKTSARSFWELFIYVVRLILAIIHNIHKCCQNSLSDNRIIRDKFKDFLMKFLRVTYSRNMWSGVCKVSTSVRLSICSIY